MGNQHYPSASDGDDLRLDIARGLVHGHRAMYKFGYGDDLDSGDEETIWDGGGIYAYPSAAAVMYVSSSSASDDDGSTGATEIQVEGLDANYDEVTETVTLNGQTQVATSASFLRVYRAFVTAVGSGGTAAGDIYIGTSGASGGVPTGTTYAKIRQGSNQTLMAIYTVPAGHSLYLDDVQFSSSIGQANKQGVFRMVVRREGQPFRDAVKFVIQSAVHAERFVIPLEIPEKADIEVRAEFNQNNSEASGAFQGMLIKHDRAI